MISMPAAIVLVVCKTILAGPVDRNVDFTKVENRKWATENSMMVCRRLVIPLHDTAADQGAPPLTPNLFNPGTCAKYGIPVGVQWDEQHRSSAYRYWKVGCPTPIIDTRTGKMIGYKMPECGNRATVRCEIDSEI